MEELIKNIEKKLKDLISKFKPEISSIRTNRPNTEFLENLRVSYFDQALLLKQLASISIVPPREIQISVWDKSALLNILKAIEESGLGLTPNVDDQVIKLNMPPLTSERREEVVRLVKKMTEENRIRVRGARDEVMKEIKKMEEEKNITEDQEFKLKERVQKLVQGTNQELEDLLNKKIIEINK